MKKHHDEQPSKPVALDTEKLAELHARLGAAKVATQRALEARDAADKEWRKLESEEISVRQEILGLIDG